MEYERIEKTGMISPSKLRMKLMGPHNLRNEEGGFNSNSSRTSPSKLDHSDFTKNSLLASECFEFKENTTYMETTPTSRKSDPKIDNVPKVGGGNPRMSYPVRVMEDENPDYDSNTSSSSFEFHKGERLTVYQLMRSGSRHMSSKWNDAEKWIRNKQQNANSNSWKKTVLMNHANHIAVTSAGTITPEHSSYDIRHPVVPRGYDSQRVDFVPSAGMPGICQDNNSGEVNMLCIDSRDMSCVDSICTRPVNDEPAGYTSIREVSMRDMGTEMTPVASQEPSRTATPVGSATPLRSPISSIPSTPRRDGSASTPADQTMDKELQYPREFCKRELTEEELKLKTRREIVALGAQLGKMNIAAWASKQETENNVSVIDSVKMKERERLEFERRAVAWEEAEKTKHTARHKREEIRIQAWESQQKAKLEAEMRRIEARLDQMRAQAQAKVVQKIETARRQSEVKRASAEDRKKSDAERIAARAEYTRQTGKIPPSLYICCGLLHYASMKQRWYRRLRQRPEVNRASAEGRKKSDAERITARAGYTRQTGKIPPSPYICCE